MNKPVRVSELLQTGGLPRLEARMLLQHVLGVPRAWLITHDRDEVPTPQAQRFEALRARRAAGEPMAYLIGEREFMGHVFETSPQALIPRPETELLVETALRVLQGGAVADAPRVLDLGTGSGAIAISIALACPHAAVVATDLGAGTLDLARRNAQALGAPVDFFQGDWYGALPAGEARRAFDLIVSNPPYIAVCDPHLEQGDLRFEPSEALTDGGDGLGALRRIVDGAAAWLKPHGWLWLEHGWDQAGAVRGLLRSQGFGQVCSHRDLAGIERVSGGMRDAG